MAVAKHSLTAEEFFKLPESRHAELIEGKAIQKMPTGKGHGGIGGNLLFALKLWSKVGCAVREEGLLIKRNPDQVRSPDVMYASAESLAADQNPGGAFWHIRPELVAEVISPGETADEVRLRLRDYQSVGVRLVLLIYALTREVEVHTPDGVAKSFREHERLEFPEVLPGFTVEVSQLFDLPAPRL